jgi:hypothetical protein
MNRLDQLFQQFLRERTYINNVTASTRDWYGCAWKAFTRTQASAPERAASVPLISKADLQHFVVELRARGVKPMTCNTWIRAMNAFCRWLHEQDEVPTLVKLAPQRLEKRIIRTHDEAALRAILTYLPKTFAHWRIDTLVSAWVAAHAEAILVRPYRDTESGAKTPRPGFDRMLKDAKARMFDRVVIWRLDRLGRNTEHLLRTVRELEEAGVTLVSVRDSVDTSTASGKAFLGMLAVFAQFERDILVERTKAGMARAKAAGVHVGRPRKVLPSSTAV